MCLNYFKEVVSNTNLNFITDIRKFRSNCYWIFI